MRPTIDPRLGDIEDDATSTKRRTLVSLAGSLLAEISLPKLIAAWAILIGLPAFLLGARTDYRYDLGKHDFRAGDGDIYKPRSASCAHCSARARLVWWEAAVAAI